MKKLFIPCLFALLFTNFCSAQQITPNILEKRWAASWIAVPKESGTGYGVYLFRKTFELTKKPTAFVIHVSGDNRYKLFVNEKLVSLGPARGDLSHWNFETVDIASYLKTGKNVVAAQVWNEGEFKPEAQVTLMTGFILQGATKGESIINTNTSWKCSRDNGFEPLQFNVETYYVSGAGEVRNMANHPKDWQKADFDDVDWVNSKPIFGGTPKTLQAPFGTANGWMLVPSSIPQMEMKDERFKKLVKTDGNLTIADGFPEKNSPITIPSQSSVTLLLDQNHLTNTYPNLVFSAGKNATLSLKYAEALYSKYPEKGNRNDTKDKKFIGRQDSLISDGTTKQQFTTLTYRTYRYVQLRIITQNEPLILEDIYGTFTGYPFEMKAKMTVNNPEIDKMLEVGWRTARLCATETYMDCPYYEQLQYIGDTRIQALVSLFNSGDDRLVKNAISLSDLSKQPEGVTMSRYPSATPQYIPTFSLWYIGMLHDYSRYGTDMDFVKSKLSGTRHILEYFKNYQQVDGSLKGVPQWTFTDWVDGSKDWREGVGPIGADGTSALLDFQLLLAYQTAADLESKLGMSAQAAIYQTSMQQLTKTIWTKYWDKDKKLWLSDNFCGTFINS